MYIPFWLILLNGICIWHFWKTDKKKIRLLELDAKMPREQRIANLKDSLTWATGSMAHSMRRLLRELEEEEK